MHLLETIVLIVSLETGLRRKEGDTASLAGGV